MPIRYEIESHLLRYLTVGDVDYQDGLRTLHDGLGRAKELARSDKAAKFDVLFDVRESTEDRSGEELRGIADVLGEHRAFLSGRAAVVAGDAFHIGLARVFSAYADGHRIEVRVFETMEDAEKWLLETRPAA